MRKHLFASIVMFWGALGSMSGQDSVLPSLHFAYIDHETNTPINKLETKLGDLHRGATEVGNAIIIYLSDNENSMVSFAGLSHDLDSIRTGQVSYKVAEFDDIKTSLWEANYHYVNPIVDRNNLLDLFERFNFINADGNIVNYSSVTLDFYVGPDFWVQGYHKQIIAHMYHALNVSKLSQENFTINVLTHDDELINEANINRQPFGNENIDGIK